MGSVNINTRIYICKMYVIYNILFRINYDICMVFISITIFHIKSCQIYYNKYFFAVDINCIDHRTDLQHKNGLNGQQIDYIECQLVVIPEIILINLNLTFWYTWYIYKCWFPLQYQFFFTLLCDYVQVNLSSTTLRDLVTFWSTFSVCLLLKCSKFQHTYVLF